MNADPYAMLDSAKLHSQLAAACGPMTSHRVMVGVFHAGETALAERDGSEPVPTVAMTQCLPAGCIAKLLTSMIALELTDQDTSAALSLLPDMHPDPFAVLLDHRHGLDASACGGIGRLANGHMDVAAAIEFLLSIPRLNPWGRIYSYSNIGCQIAAGLIERHLDRPYGELLVDFLSRGRRHSADVAPDPFIATQPICPAAGHGVSLSPMRLLEFIAAGLRRLRREPHDANGRLSRTVDLPGWHASERGIALGWKHYGGGWYGHDSIVRTSPMAVRVNPARDIGLFVRTTGTAPTPVLNRLCRDSFPELLPASIPRPLAATTSVHVTSSTYADSAMLLQIDGGPSGVIQLRVAQRTATGTCLAPALHATLRPAENQVFFVQPPQPGSFQFVQCVRDDAGSEYLWNGRSIWPRIG